MQIGCFYDVIPAGVKEMGFENIDVYKKCKKSIDYFKK